MGAYSTTPLEASTETTESAESAGSTETAESAATVESVHPEPETAESVTTVANPPVRRLSTMLSRIVAWLIFLGGLVGAGLGLAELKVEITVAGLILACTAGLVLLKLRTDRGGARQID